MLDDKDFIISQRKADKELSVIFESLLKNYCDLNLHSSPCDKHNDAIDAKLTRDIAINLDTENQIIDAFLKKGCGCGRSCQKLFTSKELIDARAKFRRMSTAEKNCFILSKLGCFSRYSELAYSARIAAQRKRQKFEYAINIDRPVCKNLFFFYYGETIDRLKRLQKNFLFNGIELPIHGNKGSTPVNRCSVSEREAIKLFIINFSSAQGLPDPGRDVRKGKGRLRILLPSVMTYMSIYALYEDSMVAIGEVAIGYQTFLKIWQEEFPYIVFNNPRSDLCIQCENFKKQLNQVAAILDEGKEERQVKIHQAAIDHINHAKKERMYYRAHAILANKNYKKFLEYRRDIPVKANSNDTLMHYSWDFAQQFHYPFEDQQVGPIYFKTPRRAQVFGICCEGIPKQINYLIDEADFLEKNANTVISLLDHFFEHHAFGETSVYLTADNCVGQNKNNALIQYLMYRVLTGLHSNIELSFLVVGHTKFSPDGYFGLIRHRYRRSQVYTYDQLKHVIEASSPNGHNACQPYANHDQPEIIYRDWTDWLSRYFKNIPGITQYHHFKINRKEKGIVKLKENVDSKEKKINLINTNGFPYTDIVTLDKLPKRLMPKGLSAERQWYLYDQIRIHIPDNEDKDKTCPKPNISKPTK